MHASLRKNIHKIQLGLRVKIDAPPVKKPEIEKKDIPKVIYVVAELVKNAAWGKIDLVNFEEPFFFPALREIVHPDYTDRLPQYVDPPAKSTPEYRPSLEDKIAIITSLTTNAITALGSFTRFYGFLKQQTIACA